MLEIPQLRACGTDQPFKIIQAAQKALDRSVLESGFLFLGLDWWKKDDVLAP